MTAATFFRAVAPLTAHLSVRTLDYIATGLADVGYFLLRKRRQAVLENITRVFGPHPSKPRVRAAARNCFRNHARCTADTLRIPYLSHSAILSMVEENGLEHLFKALRRRRGLVLATLHLGNWDLFASYLGVRHVPLSVVVEKTEPSTFAFYKKRREHTGIQTIPLTAPPLTFARVLKENRILGLVCDRDITGAGVPVKFFDGRWMMPQGPERLAQLFRAPVAVCYFVLNDKPPHRYLAVVEKITSSPGAAALTTRLAQKFEQLIRQYPDQWFIFHNEWLN